MSFLSSSVFLLTSRLFPLISNDLGLTLLDAVVVAGLLVVGTGLLVVVGTGLLRVVVGIDVVLLNTGASLSVVVLGLAVVVVVVVVGLGFLVVDNVVVFLDDEDESGLETFLRLLTSPDTANESNYR